MLYVLNLTEIIKIIFHLLYVYIKFEQTFKKLYNNYNNKFFLFLIQIMIPNNTNTNIKNVNFI